MQVPDKLAKERAQSSVLANKLTLQRQQIAAEMREHTILASLLATPTSDRPSLYIG